MAAGQKRASLHVAGVTSRRGGRPATERDDASNATFAVAATANVIAGAIIGAMWRTLTSGAAPAHTPATRPHDDEQKPHLVYRVVTLPGRIVIDVGHEGGLSDR